MLFHKNLEMLETFFPIYLVVSFCPPGAVTG